ncbi:MAG TPA: phosphotransferase [Stellaceae bacterium]|nr:phosphotransferase [Stellaceae bacterium]
MAERAELIAGFLAAAGWGAAERRLLAGDASFRRYHRLEAPPLRAVLMDAPPPQEDVRPFLAIARLLRGLGFSAPGILAEDVALGLLLLEDFGDATYTRLLAQGAAEEPLYALAVDLLVALHRGFDPRDAPGIPAYDDQRLLAEAALLVDWYLPAVSGRPLAPRLREEYLALWRGLLPLARAVPESLVLRDYHVDNLMLLEGRDGLAACGLLDFQDAVIGPVTYDLVSLLEDARRDVPPDLAEAMLRRYLAAFPDFDPAAFAASYAVLGAQRNCKIVGIFTRLCRRDGKPGYLAFIPRVWRLIEGDLRHPALAPVADWLDRHLPPDLRGVPPEASAA